MTNQNAAQESLFVTSRSTGSMVERDVYLEQTGSDIPAIERDLHLLNVLDTFAQMAQLEGLQTAAGMESEHARLRGGFGIEPELIASRAQSRQMELGVGARYEFARAHGMFARIDAGIQDSATAKAETLAAYREFAEEHARIRNAVERDKKRAELRAAIDKSQTEQTIKNREQGLRPHEEKDDGQLNIQDSLRAIADDPRAGFLPATLREKDVVKTMLDLRDNPEYPIGIRHQPLEIAAFHRKKANDPKLEISWQQGKQRGVDAAWSTTYELGDFVDDAQRQAAVLSEVQLELSEPIRPDLKLREVLGPNHPALPYIARLHDALLLRDTGETWAPLPYSPLSTRRNETALELSDFERKNKVLQDPYTFADRRVEFTARIDLLSRLLNVVDGRKLAAFGVDDAFKRRDFFVQALEDLSTPTKERVLSKSQKAATFILQRLREGNLPKSAIN